jgi:hypothetical protein
MGILNQKRFDTIVTKTWFANNEWHLSQPFAQKEKEVFLID